MARPPPKSNEIWALSALEWNAAQAEVIAAPADARLIVDAGPGTGKTAMAAGRITALIARGLTPSQLCTISFSRAAVGEMRARLLALGDGNAAVSHVTTLDSLAWHLRADSDDDGMVLEGHDRAIEETLAALRLREPNMLRRLSALQHFTIDEAQDLVGARALLVVEVLAALPPSCGVTILTDEAQAIYGFSASALTSSFAADTVAQHLLEAAGDTYRLMRLTHIHRTGDARLLRLFRTARVAAIRSLPNPATKLKRMRRAVKWRGHGRPGAADRNTLILYRRRAEVLAAAQQRLERGQAFRLRLSGLPIMLHAWIATLLHDFKSATLTGSHFEDLWAARIGGDSGAAWQILLQATNSRNAIPMPRLRAILCSSHPPAELCQFDPGTMDGPVIGTIHASKGREMERVQLMLPQADHGRDDPDGAARVLFVGATRARARLEIGRALRLDARHLATGRVYIPLGTNAARVELGRPGDFMWARDLDLSALKPGLILETILVEGVLHINHGATLLSKATPALMADLRDIRARLTGSIDYSQLTATIHGVAFLTAYTQAGPQIEDVLCCVPAVSGLAIIKFP